MNSQFFPQNANSLWICFIKDQLFTLIALHQYLLSRIKNLYQFCQKNNDKISVSFVYVPVPEKYLFHKSISSINTINIIPIPQIICSTKIPVSPSYLFTGGGKGGGENYAKNDLHKFKTKQKLYLFLKTSSSVLSATLNTQALKSGCTYYNKSWTGSLCDESRWGVVASRVDSSREIESNRNKQNKIPSAKK